MLKLKTVSVFAVLGLGSLALAQTVQSFVLYSAIGYAQPVVEAFTKATGIQVKIVGLSTGPFIAKVQAEKQNPQWNLVWFDGAEAMRALANRGFLAKG